MEAVIDADTVALDEAVALLMEDGQDVDVEGIDYHVSASGKSFILPLPSHPRPLP